MVVECYPAKRCKLYIFKCVQVYHKPVITVMDDGYKLVMMKLSKVVWREKKIPSTEWPRHTPLC